MTSSSWTKMRARKRKGKANRRRGRSPRARRRDKRKLRRRKRSNPNRQKSKSSSSSCELREQTAYHSSLPLLNQVVQLSLHLLLQPQPLQKLLPPWHSPRLLLLCHQQFHFLPFHFRNSRLFLPTLALTECVRQTQTPLLRHYLFSEDDSEVIAFDPRSLGHAIDIPRLPTAMNTCSSATIRSATSEAHRLPARVWNRLKTGRER